jgi:hypothetical protein
MDKKKRERERKGEDMKLEIFLWKYIISYTIISYISIRLSWSGYYYAT